MDLNLLTRNYCEYARYFKGLSPQTITRANRLLQFYGRTMQVKTIEEVSNSNLREFFINGRTQRNWKPRTFSVFYHTFSVFFRWCRTNGYMQSDPLDGIELPRPEKKLPTRLTKDGALKLLEVIYNYPYEYRFLRFRNHAMFSMLIFAGLRKSELLNLKVTDVDVINLTIFVNQGKGGKDRIIPMSFTLAESLRRYLDERKRLGKTCPELFTSLNRNMGFTNAGLKNLVRQMTRVTGIKFTIHWLRHTFATLMLEGGCDIYSLSKMLGHSDIKTTTIYLSATAEHLRSQVSKHPLNNLVRMA